MYTRDNDIDKIIREAVEKIALDMALEEIEYAPNGCYGLIVESDTDYIAVNADVVEENGIVHIYAYRRRVQSGGIKTISSAEYIDGKWIEMEV